MNIKNNSNKDVNKQEFISEPSVSGNNKAYTTPVLVEYGDVASIIELGGNGVVDFSGGPDFIE